MTAGGPEKIVFVGGAPRSGTTVTHALLCSSAQVSDYHPEVSFLRGLAIGYRNGLAAWRQHTSSFFKDRDDFRAHMRESFDLSIRRLWGALGERPILCMKDPLLTPFFPDLHALYPTKARFAVVVRHPYDVVRSRQAVHEKSGRAQPFSTADATAVAREYMASYQPILATRFGGRLFMFRYEDLNAERIRAGLAGFLDVDDLDPDRMWGQAAHLGDDPWGSPKYNKAIDLQSRFEPLAPDLAQPVAQICAPLMLRFNYETAGLLTGRSAT